MKTLTLSVITGLIILSIPVRAQYITKYPEIPRIDVHSHVNNNYPAISAYLAATDQYYNLVNRENLRDLFIEYADRVLFGTDVGGYNNSAIPNNVTRYANSFQILETEDIVGFLHIHNLLCNLPAIHIKFCRSPESVNFIFRQNPDRVPDVLQCQISSRSLLPD